MLPNARAGDSSLINSRFDPTDLFTWKVSFSSQSLVCRSKLSSDSKSSEYSQGGAMQSLDPVSVLICTAF